MVGFLRLPLKGVSARLLNAKHRDLIQKHLWEGHIWSPSYYIATTSDKAFVRTNFDINSTSRANGDSEEGEAIVGANVTKTISKILCPLTSIFILILKLIIT